MRPEAQRIAIAEACGWSQLPDNFSEGVRNSGFLIDPVNYETHVPPDYLNDLNAMYEAEKVFGEFGSEIWAKYQRTLRNGDVVALSGQLCHATAAQRAEAFLRTLGLWQD